MNTIMQCEFILKFSGETDGLEITGSDMLEILEVMESGLGYYDEKGVSDSNATAIYHKLRAFLYDIQ